MRLKLASCAESSKYHATQHVTPKLLAHASAVPMHAVRVTHS